MTDTFGPKPAGRPRAIDRDKLAELFALGYSNTTLAERFGCTAGTINALRHKWQAGDIHASAHELSDAIPIGPADRDQWRELQPWPADLRFEDASVPPEPRATPKPGLFDRESGGNGTAMAAAKGGFV